MHLAINGFFWNQPNSGTGQYTRQLVTHLLRLVSDLEITLVYPVTAESPALGEFPPGMLAKPVSIRNGYLDKVYFEQVLFPRICHEVGADVAHVPYWGSPLKSPTPIIITIHDLTTYLVREYRRRPSVRIYNALISASARGADHIITDSIFSKNDITTYLSIPPEKISAIYLATGQDFTPQSDLLLDMAVQQKYQLPDSYILYLGGYEIHKNVTTTLLAYSYVVEAFGDEFPLILAGEKPSSISPSYPDYDAYIRQLGLQEKVKWTGFVEEADKPAVYRGASSFVFLSRREGFGLPPLEAMACGVPVVASNCTSIPEILSDAAFCLDPDDAKQIGGSIIATILQDDLATEMKQKGLSRAATFSWEKTATETLLVYDRVAGYI